MPDDNHPLFEAMRFLDIESERSPQGTDAETLYKKLGLPTFEIVRYGAEQRALRAALVANGRAKEMQEAATAERLSTLALTEGERNLQSRLIPTYVDGIACGWKGHEISTQP